MFSVAPITGTGPVPSPSVAHSTVLSTESARDKSAPPACWEARTSFCASTPWTSRPAARWPVRFHREATAPGRYRLEFAGASSQFEISEQLNPIDAEAHCVFGLFVPSLGEHGAAERFERSARLDPFESCVLPWLHGAARYNAGDMTHPVTPRGIQNIALSLQHLGPVDRGKQDPFDALHRTVERAAIGEVAGGHLRPIGDKARRIPEEDANRSAFRQQQVKDRSTEGPRRAGHAYGRAGRAL